MRELPILAVAAALALTGCTAGERSTVPSESPSASESTTDDPTSVGRRRACATVDDPLRRLLSYSSPVPAPADALPVLAEAREDFSVLTEAVPGVDSGLGFAQVKLQTEQIVAGLDTTIETAEAAEDTATAAEYEVALRVLTADLTALDDYCDRGVGA